ncbi:unnamed protein product [Brucella canis str. Oliveri]|nr:unnamed protein product [Brucella canis str. Oliveri]
MEVAILQVQKKQGFRPAN